MNSNFSGFISKEYELLLKASLLKGNNVENYFLEWKSISNYENELDYNSYLITPFLYKNLKENKIDDPLIKILKGIYKRTWYKNNILLKRLVELLNILNSNGIDCILLKGVALIFLYYRDLGIRELADMDFLVKVDQAELVINKLEENGWFHPKNKPHNYIKYWKALDLVDKEGFKIDIHWHPFEESCWENSHSDFWDRSIELEYKSIRAKSLNITDVFFVTVIHGIHNYQSLNKKILWIADSVNLLKNKSSKIEWERLHYLSKKYWVSSNFKDICNYLNNNFNTEIPDYFIYKLTTTRKPYIEKIEYKLQTINKKNYLKWHIRLFRYLRQNRNKNLIKLIYGIIPYTKFRKNLEFTQLFKLTLKKLLN